MKKKLTDIDLRSPEYKGFWMDLVPTKTTKTTKKNINKKSKSH